MLSLAQALPLLERHVFSHLGPCADRVPALRRAKSYTDLLVGALAPSGKGGTTFLRQLRDEWGTEASPKSR